MVQTVWTKRKQSNVKVEFRQGPKNKVYQVIGTIVTTLDDQKLDTAEWLEKHTLPNGLWQSAPVNTEVQGN